jgi:phage-related protein
VSTISQNIPQIVNAGISLFTSLIQNLPLIIKTIVNSVPQIIQGIVGAVGSLVYQMADAGKNLIYGLWNGIASLGDWLWGNVKGLFGNVVSGVKNFLGIASPSKVFAGIGQNMGEGIGVGFEDAMKTVSENMNKAIPTDFDISTGYSKIGNGVQLAHQATNGSTMGNITQNISIVSPKALSEKEVAREFKNLSRRLALEV